MVRLHRKSDSGYREITEEKYQHSKKIYHSAGWRLLKEGEEVEQKEIKEVVSKEKPVPVPPVEIERVDEVKEIKEEVETKPKRKRVSKKK